MKHLICISLIFNFFSCNKDTSKQIDSRLWGEWKSIDENSEIELTFKKSKLFIDFKNSDERDITIRITETSDFAERTYNSIVRNGFLFKSKFSTRSFYIHYNSSFDTLFRITGNSIVDTKLQNYVSVFIKK